MSKSFLVLLLGVILLAVGQPSSAETYEECRIKKCDQPYASCLASITSPNDIEIQEAKTACAQAESECHDECNEAANNPPQEQQKAPEEQQKAPE